MSHWADDDRPWLAGRPAPLDPVEEALLRLDHAYRHRPGLFPTWRAALPALLVGAGGLGAWAGGAWLVARLIEAVGK